MRRKLMGLAALICLAGGSTLVAQGSEISDHWCDATGVPCSGDSYRTCLESCTPGSECVLGWQICVDGTWQNAG